VKRKDLIGSAAVVSVATMSTAYAATADRPRGALELQEQGTFYVGGERQFRSPGSSAKSDERSLPGDIAVNQMYVEYQIPAKRKYPYPLVLLHGGGHTGQFYRSTPDGREGWFTGFTRRGFAVYAVDAPNRGRAGWDPTHRLAVSQGLEPPSALEAANIYSAQSAWLAFRWGPKYGTPYPNAQFPFDHLDDYLKQIQPAYRDAAQNPAIHRDLMALVDKIGPCILLGWSTGTGNVMVAASKRPGIVKGAIGLEVFPGAEGNTPMLAEMAKIPFLGLLGDNLSPDDGRAYTRSLSALGGDATTVFLPDAGQHGNGHTMAIEKNNEAIADIIQKWIDVHAK
jgi:pimeloyl-ACP methyl ester carboxylesterase